MPYDPNQPRDYHGRWTDIAFDEDRLAKMYPTMAKKDDDEGVPLPRLGFADALEHWARGNGEPIRVPLDSLDLSGVSASKNFGNQLGAKDPVRLPGEDFFVYGTVSLTLVGPDTVVATNGHDTYDFDMKDWSESLQTAVRNLLTIGGNAVSEGYSYGRNLEIDGTTPIDGGVATTRGGIPFKIHLEGKAKIAP